MEAYERHGRALIRRAHPAARQRRRRARPRAGALRRPLPAQRRRRSICPTSIAPSPTAASRSCATSRTARACSSATSRPSPRRRARRCDDRVIGLDLLAKLVARARRRGDRGADVPLRRRHDAGRDRDAPRPESQDDRQAPRPDPRGRATDRRGRRRREASRERALHRRAGVVAAPRALSPGRARRGRAREQVAAHLAACPACAACLAHIEDDDARALPPSARCRRPRGAPSSRSSRVRAAAALGALAAAAALVLGLRGDAHRGRGRAPAARREPRQGRRHRVHARARRRRAHRERRGRRTATAIASRRSSPAPRGRRSRSTSSCTTRGGASFPLEPARGLACGNDVPLPGAFRLTGDDDETVCLVWGEGGPVDRGALATRPAQRRPQPVQATVRGATALTRFHRQEPRREEEKRRRLPFWVSRGRTRGGKVSRMRYSRARRGPRRGRPVCASPSSSPRAASTSPTRRPTRARTTRTPTTPARCSRRRPSRAPRARRSSPRSGRRARSTPARGPRRRSAPTTRWAPTSRSTTSS